ncbi:hypothetical protein B5X24_HaOG213097 [Helicoverpa armigera]|nr:hypothetical protein B5X24_HaOG213097 [Helicoverpa armigera]
MKNIELLKAKQMTRAHKEHSFISNERFIREILFRNKINRRSLDSYARINDYVLVTGVKLPYLVSWIVNFL